MLGEIKSKIGFIGAGNMGSAIIRGLLAHSVYEASEILVSDPSHTAKNSLRNDFPDIGITENLDDFVRTPVVVLAVKPQIYRPLAEDIRSRIAESCIITTIAPGIKIKTLSSWLGGHKKIIRTMPNTPAIIGEGMTALCAAAAINSQELKMVQEIFNSIGSTLILKEDMLNIYTSLAGSSPAWLFMFIEAMADAAVREGLARPLAYKIAARAICGSSRLIEETEQHPAELKDQVCSPAGTTIEAVSVLESKGFRSAIIEAVRACTARANEMENLWKK